MIYDLNIELSAELEQFRDKIESTVKPFIQIIPQLDTDLNWWQSKLGGLPYLPHNCQYPRDDQGNPLFLLAQINLEEMPYLEDFPEHGILQFYIANENAYGIDWKSPTQQPGFRCWYFPEVSKSEADLVTDFSFLSQSQPDYLPFSLNTSCSLQFQKQIAPVGITDYEFKTLLGDHFLAQFGDKKEAIWEEYVAKFPSDGHKIGGYAYFTQEDPRLNQEEQYLLLLQIDSDDSVDIMWGDGGVGNFFIKPADLAKQDFSKVFYNWDCH